MKKEKKEKKKFITKNEIKLVLAFTVLSFLLTTKHFILFLDKLNPLSGFVVYYIFVYATLALLSWGGLIIFGIEIKHFTQVLGSGLVFFCFFLIFNLTNPYVQYLTMGNLNEASGIFYQSEDGMMWYLWSFLIHPTTELNIQILRILAFPVTIFILMLLAVILINRKINFDGI